MASISRDKNGSKRIGWTDANGTRRSLRLGKVPLATAERMRSRVEALLTVREYAHAPDAELAAWLGKLSDRAHDRLARLGLAGPRTRGPEPTLGTLIERFEQAATVKHSTRAAYRQCTGSLLAVLGEHLALSELTPEHADRWRKALSEPTGVPRAPKADAPPDLGPADRRSAPREPKALSPATIAKRIFVARCLFRRAVRWGLIASNPFEHLRAGSQSNPERTQYIDAGTIRAVLAECPDAHWRALVALSRFAGLRCPSEHSALRWADVNWERGRLTVRSPKTAGHEGHAVRIVPIGPELRAALLDLFEQAEPGVEAVLPRLADGRANLRTNLHRIIERAGVKPWPRLFHNLRASCAMDWCEAFPAHVVASWLGHSPLIAAKHYLRTQDSHFERAAGTALSPASPTPTSPAPTSPTPASPARADPTPGPTREPGPALVLVGGFGAGPDAHAESGAKCGARVAQKAAQRAFASDRAERAELSEVPVFTGVSRPDANRREGPAKGDNGRNRTRTCDLGYVTAAL
jgi:integrase